MEAAIKRRLLKGWKPTKLQVQYIKDNIDPRYCNTCGFCAYNLALYFSLPGAGK